MSSSPFLADEPHDRCDHIFAATKDAKVRCSRPAGHRPTGHEYVGDWYGQHIHIIWGEPSDVCSEGRKG